MEKSEHTEEILKLGKKIIDELELNRDTDTLSRWLSHHLAENMVKIKEETDLDTKKALESETCDLILKIWDRRSIRVPNLSPVSDVSGPLEVLEALREKPISSWAFMRRLNQEDSPLVSFIEEYYMTGKEVIETIITLSTLPDELLSAKKWKEEYGNLLSHEEYRIIELLELNDNEFRAKRKDRRRSKDESFKQAIIKRLDLLLTKQRSAYKKLKKTVVDQSTDRVND